MNTAGTVILIIVLLLIAGGVGWVLFARWRAQRLGLPPPSWSSFIPFYSSDGSYGVQPAPGGIRGWFNDHVRSFRSHNARTAAGAYEGGSAAGGARSRSGFGPLDPDDAWDARVGANAEAYYYNEEQELGLHSQQQQQQQRGLGGIGAAGGPNNSSRLNVGDTSYLGSGPMGGSSYDMNLASSTDDYDEERGRSRGRSPVKAATPGPTAAAAAAAHGTARNPFDDDDADPSNLSLRGVSPRPMSDPQDPNKSDSPTERRSIFRENV